jgi:tRNA modification GTPase
VAAQQALAEASTVRTAAILLDQYHGAFSKVVRNILDHLHHSQFQQATDQLQELARWIPLGRHLTRPWRVAIAGAPNVGKSSLLNRLAGFQRCVVSPLPGTTRDVVTARLAVDGWPMEFVDTAGVRDQAEALEQQGIELALAAATEADLCLWLLDASAPPVMPPREVPGLRLVINKIDLPPAWNLDQFPQALRISAETGIGIDELQHALSGWLVPQTPTPGAAVPFHPQLGDVIEEAWQCCGQEKWEDVKQMLYNMLEGK